MKTLEEEISMESKGMSGGYHDFRSRAEDYARHEPMQALGAAAGAGVLFHFLPLGKLCGGLFRLTMFMAKPALMVLGAMAVYKELSGRKSGGFGL